MTNRPNNVEQNDVADNGMRRRNSAVPTWESTRSPAALAQDVQEQAAYDSPQQKLKRAISTTWDEVQRMDPMIGAAAEAPMQLGAMARRVPGMSMIRHAPMQEPVPPAAIPAFSEAAIKAGGYAEKAASVANDKLVQTYAAAKPLLMAPTGLSRWAEELSNKLRGRAQRKNGEQ